MTTQKQVDEVRNIVDEEIAKGNLYRDPQGRIWPKGHPNYRPPVKH